VEGGRGGDVVFFEPPPPPQDHVYGVFIFWELYRGDVSLNIHETLWNIYTYTILQDVTLALFIPLRL